MNVTFILKEHQIDEIFVIGHQPGPTKPVEFTEKTLHSRKVTVWCAWTKRPKIYIYMAHISSRIPIPWKNRH